MRDKPGVHYIVMQTGGGGEWRHVDAWPVPGISRVTHFLDEGKRSNASLNDGALVLAPGALDGSDSYTVDYDLTTRDLLYTRWQEPFYGSAPKLDTTPIDVRSLTYTTMEFDADTEITGAPVLSLWVTSTSPEPDLYAYISVVDADGTTTRMTDGTLRAANRVLRTPSWPNDGLPWHGSFSTDHSPLVPGEPALLELALFPTSFLVQKGQRVRLTVNGFDRDVLDTPVEDQPPVITVLRGRDHHSALSLPIVGQADG